MKTCDKGLSLIEMMVTVAIFGFLLTAFLTFFKNTNKNLLAQRVISNRDFLAKRIQNLIANQETLEISAKKIVSSKSYLKTPSEGLFASCVLGSKTRQKLCVAGAKTRQSFQLFEPTVPSLPASGTDAKPVFYTSDGRKCGEKEPLLTCPFQVVTLFEASCSGEESTCSQAEAIKTTAEISVRKGQNGKPIPVNPAGEITLSPRIEEATVILKKSPAYTPPSPIVFSLGKSNAQLTSCLSVSLNGSPFLRVACNHPKNTAQVARLSLHTLASPSCNVIQYLVETSSLNGAQKWVRTTATTIDLSHFILLDFKKVDGFYDVSIGYEDNAGNSDYDDLVFTMRIKDSVFFQITNLNQPGFKKNSGISSIPNLCQN